jgi:hypothetical protein
VPPSVRQDIEDEDLTFEEILGGDDDDDVTPPPTSPTRRTLRIIVMIDDINVSCLPQASFSKSRESQRTRCMVGVLKRRLMGCCPPFSLNLTLHAPLERISRCMRRAGNNTQTDRASLVGIVRKTYEKKTNKTRRAKI